MIVVTTSTGKKFRIPARGYNLRSWLNFEESLKSKHSYFEVPPEEYIGYWDVDLEEETKKVRKKKSKNEDNKQTKLEQTT